MDRTLQDKFQVNQRFCATSGCKNVAILQCPVCVQLKLKKSYYCSQKCFESFWSTHKLVHFQQSQSNVFIGSVKPYPYSFQGQRAVPKHIKKPDYASSGQPSQDFHQVCRKAIQENNLIAVQKIKQACKIGRLALDYCHSLIKPGLTTEEIDEAVHNFIINNNAYPSILNYYGYPRSCCTSVNEIICHGVPDQRPLKEGDILSVDIAVYKNGYHGDLSESFCVGKVDEQAKYLLQTTYEALEKAIEYCKPGAAYCEIGNIISDIAESRHFSVVKDYVGHGIGRQLHSAPEIPNYRNNKVAGFMKPGHVFTIEPMINQGTYDYFKWQDNWTVSTKDGKLSAQFEHTILITETGCEVLTARLSSSPKLEF